MEKWKEVEGTNGKILISSNGRVKSLLRDERILKTQPDAKGYQRVSVTINRVKSTYKVHRLVAKAFVDNPDNKPQVNHIDGDKTNNAYWNLEWTTNKENAHHAIQTGLWKNTFEAASKSNDNRKKPIVATSVKTGKVITFDSVADAERAIGSRHVSDVLKGKRSKAKGYIFSYREEVMS